MPVILFAVFIDLVGFGIIVPILPFLTLKFGGDAMLGVSLVSIYSLMAFASGPIWGRVSDKFGRRPALAGTFLGATLSYIALAHADSLLLLFVARALSGAMAGNVGIVMATMADITTPANRGKAMGYIGAAFGLGFAFGPGIGGLLAEATGETSIYLPGLTAAGLSFIAMLLTAKFVPETNPDKLEAKANGTKEVKELPRWSEILKSSAGVSIFLIFVIAAVGQSTSFSMIPFWAEDMLNWSSREVGFLMMVSGLCVALIQAFAIGPLFSKLGELKSLALGASVNIAGCLIVTIMPASILSAAIGFPMIMTGMTLAFPALNSLLSQRTDKRLQGSALGFSNGLSAAGRIFGPLFAGTLFLTVSPDMPFLLVATTSLIIFVWCVYENRKTEAPHAEQVTPSTLEI